LRHGTKRAEDGDGIIVRLYNTLDEPAETTVDIPLAKGLVSRVNLNEEHIEHLNRDDDGVTIEARQNEIVTLRFRKE
jgi:alpha-mannosidase